MTRNVIIILIILNGVISSYGQNKFNLSVNLLDFHYFEGEQNRVAYFIDNGKSKLPNFELSYCHSNLILGLGYEAKFNYSEKHPDDLIIGEMLSIRLRSVFLTLGYQFNIRKNISAQVFLNSKRNINSYLSYYGGKPQLFEIRECSNEYDKITFGGGLNINYSLSKLLSVRLSSKIGIYPHIEDRCIDLLDSDRTFIVSSSIGLVMKF